MDTPEHSMVTLQHLSEALKHKDYTTSIMICEELELQAALQGHSFELYTLELFLLLLQDQCHLASYLWKRCPYSQREPRLVVLKEIALALSREDYATAFSLCKDTDWQDLSEIAKDFLDVWRARLTEKLQSTYTFISLDDCCRYLGMTREEWMTLSKPYWDKEGDYVSPKNTDQNIVHPTSCLEENSVRFQEPLETLTHPLMALAKHVVE